MNFFNTNTSMRDTEYVNKSHNHGSKTSIVTAGVGTGAANRTVQSIQNKSWSNLQAEKTRPQRTSNVLSPTQHSKGTSKSGSKHVKNPMHGYHHSVSNSFTMGGYAFGDGGHPSTAHALANQGYQRGYIGGNSHEDHLDDNPL